MHLSDRILKLSLGQLAAAITVAIQAKNAILLTRFLSHNTTLIAIGVNILCIFMFLHMIDALLRYGEAVVLLAM